jgi:hypothetical protein
MSQVHKHPHSVVDHCVCLLQLFYFCGFGMKFILLMWKNNEQQIISFERVAQDNTRLVGCTSIYHTCTLQGPHNAYIYGGYEGIGLH